MDFYEEIVSALKERNLNKRELNLLKNKLSAKYKLKKIPTNADILLNTSPENIDKINLITKPTRTLSGVAPVALMSKPHHCPHGTCIYCPGGPDSVFGNVPQSYTGKEPSTMRSIRNNYDPYLIVINRLQQYVILNQNAQKVEIIIQGGTFPALDKEYKYDFVTYIFKALNDFSDMFYLQGKIDYKTFKHFFELPDKINNQETKHQMFSALV